jgi:hypothetical protein
MARLSFLLAGVLFCVAGAAPLEAQDQTPSYSGDLWSQGPVPFRRGRSSISTCTAEPLRTASRIRQSVFVNLRP